MFGPVGIPELLILLVMSGMWLIPLAVAIWVVVTLNRVKKDQQAIRAAVEAIQQSLPT